MAVAALNSSIQVGLSILIIEDDNDDVRLISHLLSLPGATEHGLNDLNLLNSQYLKNAEEILQNEQVDLILLDLHLPDGQGRSLVRRVCSSYPKIPVIAMTGARDALSQSTELLLEGAQDFIRKDTMDGATLFRSIQYSLNRQKLASELQAQKEELSISNAELATISNIACNNLTTPINDLRTFTEQLEKSLSRARRAFSLDSVTNCRRQDLIIELSEQMPSAIDLIKSALNNMSELSQGIKTLNHLDNRVLKFEDVDCHEIMEQLISSNKGYIEANKVKVELNLLNTVVADRQSMLDILQGVFNNALKYLDLTRDGHISISSHRDLTYTTFMIRDNGRGMTQEQQERVFEVIQRGNDVVNISGEGMGMPFVQALVRRHRGVIWFETNNSGTVFYFTIDNNLTRSETAAEAPRPSRDQCY
tara:strand:- start:2235 stop:3494 length:1260 start_codon:yes stop_codon:yes gene_type:complete